MAATVKEEKKKEKADQEFLDSHIKDLPFQDCCDYYDSIRDTTDVYMVPMGRYMNGKYKYWHPETWNGIPGRYDTTTIRSDIDTIVAEWNEKLERINKYKNRPYWDYDNFMYVDNPEHKYNYTLHGCFAISFEKNFMKSLFGIELKRIYTRETWIREIPRKIRNMFELVNELLGHTKAESTFCLDFFKHTVMCWVEILNEKKCKGE